MYLRPHIPPAALGNAIHTFAVGLSFDQALALLDDTPFGQCYSGVLVATTGIHARVGVWRLSRTASVPWASVFDPQVEIRAEARGVSHDCVVGEARLGFCYRRALAEKLAECLRRVRAECGGAALTDRGAEPPAGAVTKWAAGDDDRGCHPGVGAGGRGPLGAGPAEAVPAGADR